jgi:hypothetical protein
MARRNSILANDRPAATTLARMILIYTPALIFAVSSLFMVLPRTLFASSLVDHVVSWATVHWRKMSFDYKALYSTDARLAAKFVTFNVVIAVISLGSIVTLAPKLWYYVWIDAAPAPEGTNSPKRRFQSAVVLVFCVLYVLFVADPWPAKGYIRNLLKSEISFWFDATLWSLLVISVSLTPVQQLKALSGKPEHAPGRIDDA